MAVVKDLSMDNGVQVPQAYFRIEKVDGSKSNMRIYMRSYKDQQMAAGQNPPFISEHVYYFTPSVADDAPNYHKQGYEYIKTLTDFEGAIDA